MSFAVKKIEQQSCLGLASQRATKKQTGFGDSCTLQPSVCFAQHRLPIALDTRAVGKQDSIRSPGEHSIDLFACILPIANHDVLEPSRSWFAIEEQRCCEAGQDARVPR